MMRILHVHVANMSNNGHRFTSKTLAGVQEAVPQSSQVFVFFKHFRSPFGSVNMLVKHLGIPS